MTDIDDRTAIDLFFSNKQVQYNSCNVIGDSW